MKKFIIIFLILGLLAGAGFGAYHFLLRKELTVERVLPQGALFYVQLSDTQKNLERFTTTPFWKNLSSVNYELLASNVKFTQGANTVVELFKQQINNPSTNQVFKNFLGKEVALAIYPMNVDPSSYNPQDPQSFNQMLEGVFSSIYLVTRIDPQVQLAEYVSRSFRQIGANVTTQQINYQGNDIILVSISDSPFKIAYTRLKDLLVISVGEAAAKNSIDVYTKKSAALADDIKFKKAMAKKLDSSLMAGYADIGSFFTYVDNKMQAAMATIPNAAAAANEFSSAMEILKGFKVVSFSTQWKEILKGNIQVIFDKKVLKSDLFSFYQNCTPVENKSLKLIPLNALAYQWTNCFDIERTWSQIKLEMAKKNDPKTGLSAADQIQNYEQMLGLTIEGDIIPAFGKQIGGYLQNIETIMGFPIPTFVLFIEVADQAKSDKILGLLKNIPLIKFDEQTFSDVSMHVATTPLGTSISPSYCYLDKYLLISNSKTLLENSIEANKDQSKSLISNPSFKEVDFGVSGKNVGSSFVDFDRLMDKAQVVVEWGSNWMAATDDKKQAFKAGSEKRLVDIKSKIARDEQTIKDKELLAKTITDEIQSIQSKGADATEKQKNQKQITDEIVKLKEDVDSFNDQIVDLEKVIKGYETNNKAPKNRSQYIGEIVDPLIKTLKSMRTYGGYSTILEDSFETNFFIKL